MRDMKLLKDMCKCVFVSVSVSPSQEFLATGWFVHALSGNFKASQIWHKKNKNGKRKNRVSNNTEQAKKNKTQSKALIKTKTKLLLALQMGVYIVFWLTGKKISVFC